MKKLIAIAAGLLLAACAAKEAAPAAQTPAAATTEASVAQAGIYVFDSEPGAAVACIMKLDDNRVDDAPGFHNVWLGPGCEHSFAVLSALTGWEEMDGGGVRLIAAEGSTFGEFTRGDDGLLRGRSQNDGKTYTLHLGE